MNSFIHTAVPNTSKSIEYFQQLGFTQVQSGDQTYFASEKLLIELNEERFARPGIKMYRESWDSVLDLGYPTAPFEGGQLLRDPNGVWLYLMEGLSQAPELAPTPSKSELGNYAGVSIETLDMAASILFWESLGFAISMGEADKGWVVLANGDGMAISFMKALTCPHSFISPSLTYFNGHHNEAIIARIRELGIPIEEEIRVFNEEGKVDNVFLREPGGWGIFVFNDG